jgi:hypothetical protein
VQRISLRRRGEYVDRVMAAQTAFDATFQSGNWVQGGIPEARLEKLLGHA